MLSKTDKPGEAQPPELTLLLNRMQRGDRDAAERAASLVYQELRRIASREMRRERRDHMLQTTALVSEAYLRLSQLKTLTLQDRGHFFALASQQMRRILVDYARLRNAERRGGGEYALDIDRIQVSANHKGVNILRLDDALTALERIDPRAAKVIELRYFGGNTDKEVAEALNLSLASVRRDWEFAKSWLFSELGKHK